MSDEDEGTVAGSAGAGTFKPKKYPRLKQCFTVGQLIEELQRLPADMQLGMESDDGVVLVAVNVGRDDECLDVSYADSDSWQRYRDWEPRE